MTVAVGTEAPEGRVKIEPEGGASGEGASGKTDPDVTVVVGAEVTGGRGKIDPGGAGAGGGADQGPGTAVGEGERCLLDPGFLLEGLL